MASRDSPFFIARHRMKIRLRRFGQRVFARLAGLPTSLRKHYRRSAANPAARVRRAYATRYWKLSRPSDVAEILFAVILVLPVLIGLSLFYLWRNGSIVALQFDRPLHSQFIDHFRLFFCAGVLPPWYYIYELYRDPGKRHARGFITRWESKAGVIALLKERKPPRSVVSDKVVFARDCRRSGLPSIPVIGVAKDGVMRWHRSRFEGDWFVKPIGGKGGRGIERWDRVDRQTLRRGSEMISRAEIARRLAQRSATEPCLIQPRIENHPDLADLNNGALATVRALTCLDEQSRPELVGAVFRMATGSNNVVDNMHAGGIVAGIDLAAGTLGPASNLGTDVRLGWLSAHPVTGAGIEGRVLPFAAKIKPFAESAHRAFADRVIIGWDIAITPDGLLLVEANGAPDLDIMQRSFRCGLMRGRLGELLAFHLETTADPRSAV